MTRDFKSRAETDGKAKKPCFRAIWFVSGLILGAFVVGLAWLQLDPGLARSGNSLKETGVPRPRVDKTQRQPASTSFEFEFPDLLRKMEVIVPNNEEEPAPAPPPIFTNDRKTAAGQPSYLLQLGSFRKFSDAEQLKAKLALMGVITRIQKAKINNGQTFHRVRSGPYHNQAELNEARVLLSRHGIDPMIIKK